MFYNTLKNNHNLKYNPFKSCIVPRPIGWISTLSKENIVNLAPYSYFNAVSDIPPIIMFASSRKDSLFDKDTLTNIEQTKEFVVNIASYDSREILNLTSKQLPHNVSETEEFKIKTSDSYLVKAPRVTEALINLECKHLKTIELDIENKKASSKIIFGHVVGIHIDDSIIDEGKINIAKLKPLARLGYDQYAYIDKIFTLSKA